MKSIRLALVIVGALALSGCATGTSTNPVQQVRDAAVNICKYLPTAGSVAAILAKAGSLDSVISIATQICAAVTTLPLADGPGGRKPRVKGVVVKGSFVK